jgi:hypothetical protein
MSFPRRRGRKAFASIALSVSFACRLSTPSPLDCAFIPVQRPEDELANCASVKKDGSLVLAPKTISAIRGRDHERVAVIIGSTLYYVNPDGRVAPVLLYENGADYFAEGLARTPRRGRIGFIDRDLVEQIPPSWDFAFPFDGGVALVCQDCRSYPAGEHREVRGGVWGYINRDGVEVVPVRFEREDLPTPQSQ